MCAGTQTDRTRFEAFVDLVDDPGFTAIAERAQGRLVKACTLTSGFRLSLRQLVETHERHAECDVYGHAFATWPVIKDMAWCEDCGRAWYRQGNDVYIIR